MLDPLYVCNLDMANMTIKSVFDRMFLIDNLVLDKICEKILPQIQHQVKKLTVESHSMQRILTLNYPQVYSLSLVDFHEEMLFPYITGDETLCNLLTGQSTHLNIDIQNDFTRTSSIIDVKNITLPIIANTKKLPKLKYFSFTSFGYTICYGNCIIPLLRRMINVEELKLFLLIIRADSTYIDGIQLHDEIFIHIPRLNKFTFSINTTVVNDNIKTELASNEDIQRSFIGRGYGQVGSCVHTGPKENEGSCHVYSLPYQFEGFFHLNSSFQGGMFNNVQCLVMTDKTNPFEHQFFQIISQDFPFLKELYISNDQPQKDKQQSSALIVFPHLILLFLAIAHVDYVEQFLFDESTHLPRLLDLTIGYEELVKVTHNFTNDAACSSCARLKSLVICDPFVRPENFDQYFPLL